MKKTTFPLQETLTRGVVEILPKKETLEKLMSEAKSEGKKIRLYLGIDPTGNLLHLGHSIPLRKLNQFAQLGHDVILLIGNGTVKIGDPTGRDDSRPMLTEEEIEENFKSWKKQASKILDFDKITIMRNGDWLDKLNYVEMVKLMAKTTVQQLIERDMFQERMKKGLPIHGHEIMYPMMQGYDSVAMDVDLEIGGTDQTFNMMMGRTLQKAYNNREKWVLTVPIIDGTDGRKMSKSYNNFVSLTENPIDMYGKLMRITDDMITKYFILVTSVEMEEIKKISSSMIEGENPMTFKKLLAFTVTEELHSAEEAEKAQKHFEDTIQNKQVGEETEEIQRKAVAQMSLVEFVANLSGESNSQARRLIEQGAVSLLPSGKKLTDPNIEPNFFDDAEAIKIGKRKIYKLV